VNKKRLTIVLAVSGVIFGGVFGFVQFRNHMIKQYFATMPKPVIAVTADAAQTEQWQGSLSAVGTLQAVNGVDVSTSVAGLVEHIAFQSGQTVKKGQLLLKLDSAVEQSNLRSALADADLAKVSANRQRTLIKSETVSQSALDKAEAELKVKDATVAGHRAQIEKKSVFAPFDGTLGMRKVDLGQYLQPGQTIVNLQDLSVMLADFTLSQKAVEAVKSGAKVRMTTDAWPGRVFDGSITAIEPQLDAKTGMLTAQASFANPDAALRPGMFVRIDVLRDGARSVVAMPVSAVAYNLYGDSAFVIQDGPDGKSVRRQFITLGERRDGRIEILNGIQPGDVVVTSGQVKLENGSKVDIRQDDPLKSTTRR